MLMKLYTFRKSPNPLKARLALSELKLKYEPIEINLFKREHISGDFQEINPFEAVPVLVDGPLVLRESNAILSYLGLKYPSSLWPKDPQQAALITQWLFTESCHLYDPCSKLWWSETMSPRLKIAAWDEESLHDAADDLTDTLTRIEPHFETHPYLLGTEFSIADCCIGVTLNLLRKTRLSELRKWPAIRDYTDRIIARPSWSECQGHAIYGD